MISVILPTYNSGKTIKRALDSIINQTYRKFEIIIVDGGSTDNTLDILNSYKRERQGIILVEQGEPLGIANGLNVGLKKASGNYIARMDADDYSYPERFEKQIEFLEENSEIALCGTNIRYIRDTEEWCSSFPGDSETIKALMPFMDPLAHPTIMAKRSFFQDNMYDESAVTEDYELWLRNCLKAKYANLDEVLLDYYISNNNSSSEKKAKFYAITLRRKYIKKYFEVETSNYSDFCIMNEFGINETRNNPYTIIETLDLYKKVYAQNKKRGYCTDEALTQALDLLWEAAIWMYFYDNHSSIDNLRKWKNTNIEDLKVIIDEKKKKIDACKNIIVYGVGNNINRFFENTNYKDLNIYFCDSNPQKQSTTIFSTKIESPKEALQKKYDLILIGPILYFDEIKKSLVELYNVSEEVIEGIDILKYRK
ncbi:MAG: glycosyltransferase [Pseudobutyrivibrio sp.]|nr:glycosyltransferase [Pseudobutyrivibrio sp.]